MSGTRRLRLLASAGGAALVLTTCGARGMTTAEPAARIVSICPAPGRARLSCDTDTRELAQARRLTERVATAATAAATTTPTTAATTTSTAATTTTPTTVAETTTVATAAPAPAPEAAPADTAAPAEPTPDAAAPEAEAPAEPEPEEEPATTAPKRKKTPKTTPAPAPAEEPPATEAPAPADTEPPAAAPSIRVDTSVAGRVIALTNAKRAAAGLGPLSANGALTAAAAGHSKDQAAMNKMTHTGSNGSTLGQRISAAGFSWHTAAENVAAGYGSADSVAQGWFSSGPHFTNMMKPEFTSVGVAVAYGADGTPYWTMDLGA